MNNKLLARAVAESQLLGRKLKRDEALMFLDGDEANIRPDNLVVIPKRTSKTLFSCSKCSLAALRDKDSLPRDGLCLSCREEHRRGLWGDYILECENCGVTARCRLQNYVAGIETYRGGPFARYPSGPLCRECNRANGSIAKFIREHTWRESVGQGIRTLIKLYFPVDELQETLEWGVASPWDKWEMYRAVLRSEAQNAREDTKREAVYEKHREEMDRKAQADLAILVERFLAGEDISFPEWFTALYFLRGGQEYFQSLIRGEKLSEEKKVWKNPKGGMK